MADKTTTCDGCEAITAHYNTLVDQMKYVDHIVEQLVIDGCVTVREQVEVINNGNRDNEYERKRQLLKLIKKHRADRALARALSASGQRNLCGLIWRGEELSGEGCGTLQYRVWCEYSAGHVQLPTHITSLPPHLKQKLINATDELVHGMTHHVAAVAHQLRVAGCLTDDALTEVQAAPGDEERVRRLLQSVDDTASYLLLTECLRTCGQTALCTALRDDHTPTLDPALTDRLRILLCREKIRDAAARDDTGHRYVELHAVSEARCPDRRGPDQFVFDRSPAQQVPLKDILDQMSQHKRVLVVGAPGCGKSRACSYIRQRLLDAPAAGETGAGETGAGGTVLPVLVRLRSLEAAAMTSLRELLLAHVPHREDTGRALMACAEAGELVIVLDGADECPVDFMNVEHYVSEWEQRAALRTVLASLVTGRLLPQCRLLLTSRPFNLARCWQCFDKKFEIIGFRDESIEELLVNELGAERARGVWDVLRRRAHIMSLCRLPLNAVSLVEHVRYTAKTDTDFNLQSRTDFIRVLMTASMKKTNSELKGANWEEEDVWARNRAVVLALGRLGLRACMDEGRVRSTFTGRELSEAGVDDQRRKTCGLLTANFREFTNPQGPGVKEVEYEVELLSVVEFMTALVAVADPGTLHKLVHENSGQYDQVLLYTAALAGHHADLLRMILSDEPPGGWAARTRDVAGELLSTYHRLTDHRRAFVLRVVHASGQWLNLDDTAREAVAEDAVTVTDTDDCRAAAHLRPLVVHVGEGRLLGALGGLTHIMIRGVHNDLVTQHAACLEHVECLGVESAGITGGVCEALCSLSRLHSLSLIRNNLRGSDLSWLHRLPALTRLSLARCSLVANDVVCLLAGGPGSLQHLDISYNPAVDLGRLKPDHVRGLRSLDVKGCGRDGRWMEQTFSEASKLTSLVLGPYTVSADTWRRLDAQCPRLTELSVAHQPRSTQPINLTFTRRLARLHLSHCDVSALGDLGDVTHLSLLSCRLDTVTSLRASRLQSLFMSSPAGRPADLPALCSEMSALSELWLDGFSVSHVERLCAAVSARVRTHKVLDTLGLGMSSGSITPDWVRSLSALTTSPSRLWLAGQVVDCSAELRELDVRLSAPRPPHVVRVCDVLYRTYRMTSDAYTPHIPPSARRILHH